MTSIRNHFFSTHHFSDYGMDFTTFLPDQAHMCNFWRLTTSPSSSPAAMSSGLPSRCNFKLVRSKSLCFSGPHNMGEDAIIAKPTCCIFGLYNRLVATCRLNRQFRTEPRRPRGTPPAPQCSNTVHTRIVILDGPCSRGEVGSTGTSATMDRRANFGCAHSASYAGIVKADKVARSVFLQGFVYVRWTSPFHKSLGSSLCKSLTSQFRR